MNNKGMIPIVKYFLIILLAVGAYFGYKKGMEYYLKTQIFQAKSDIENIVKNVKKFRTVQSTELTNLDQLQDNYMRSIEYLKDPWGNKYQLDLEGGVVYSSGPDGLHSDDEDETWDDDIFLTYLDDDGDSEDNN